MSEKNFEAQIRREGKKAEESGHVDYLVETGKLEKKMKDEDIDIVENQEGQEVIMCPVCHSVGLHWERCLKNQENLGAEVAIQLIDIGGAVTVAENLEKFRGLDKRDALLLRHEILSRRIPGRRPDSLLDLSQKMTDFFGLDDNKPKKVRYSLEDHLESEEYKKYLSMLEVEIKLGLEQRRRNIKELIDQEKLSDRQKISLEKAQDFCETVSGRFAKEFGEILVQYSRERKEISNEMKKFLLDKKFDLPQFTVANGEKASELLRDLGFSSSGDLNDQALLLVFQLPRPLSFFWWKGGATFLGFSCCRYRR
ncbi:MAG: hypothetical protein G01um101418_594 [Parcubacteria group bacterium Gr01-1014_18]|nr:MAG: hypothetical protein Greene041636_115 [Parcubacteria group bacterium Greene0416_36]TSC80846.1 MAG: hypothetical protein G01um101418_594 [Parcubacteria group bacterium Gr01-1014_18]TSC99507.1 MAG: hypothetical protein Greene101420_174 [Parcubacteria group bacterium Greene1014_20]TSD07573.1 MAG: hypothetical protein Greene07142_30 [Parcubacteria group bacterium Greene0714_2]